MSKVNLISYSTSAIPLGALESPPEALIEFCARVSNPEGQKSTRDAVGGLTRYLIKHKHWSPFEMVNVCLEIETPRDIARQILRHRSFSFQEFSQRYSIANVFTTREARMQDTENRQNSLECATDRLQAQWAKKQTEVLKIANEVYNWALDQGIAKEQSRVVLPEGLTMSRMYMNGTLRSWLHYCELRMGPETQKEHREVATMCAQEIAKVFPNVLKEVLTND